MNILITGGAGFVGSSLGILIKKQYPNYEVIAMDNLMRRGSELNLVRLKKARIRFVHGDIRNTEDFQQIDKKIDLIIEASAEPSVLAGINNSPQYVINTNLMGAINCLNFAQKQNAIFIFLSTSRVYPIEQVDKIKFVEDDTRFAISSTQHLSGISKNGISEKFPLDGYRSFYGASKLAAELMIHEFNQFYGIKTVINRCGVLTGPWQMGKVDQGVIVLWVARHFWKNKLAYFGYGGEGKQVRDILHVEDLWKLIDFQVHNIDKVNGEILNVGGGNEISVSLKELTDVCRTVTGNEIPIQKVSETRQADIRIYITDNSKVTDLTGWTPNIAPDDIVREIHSWIKSNQESLIDILN